MKKTSTKTNKATKAAARKTASTTATPTKQQVEEMVKKAAPAITRICQQLTADSQTQSQIAEAKGLTQGNLSGFVTTMRSLGALPPPKGRGLAGLSAKRRSEIAAMGGRMGGHKARATANGLRAAH